MRERLLSAREAVVWAACFLAVAATLVLTHFTSTDPDSQLYAGLADRLSQEPISRWLAPEWWGFWPKAQLTGLFREHPAGVLLLPAALARLGIPALQGAYVVGAAAGLGSLVLMSSLVRRFSSRDDGRAALVLLQLIPLAFVFRIRANHEYPMLVCLLVALTGLALASRSRWALGALLVSVGLAGGLVIKGVFVTMIVLAIALWIAINPLNVRGARWRCALAGLAGVAASVAVAIAYDACYRSATGEPFWSQYWQRQLGPLAESDSVDVGLTFARHVGFYLSRLLWHPAPWSLALLAAVWKSGRALPARLRAVAVEARRGLFFALVFAGLAVLILSPAGRVAERYAFPAAYAIACAGLVVGCRIWPRVLETISRCDRRIPAFPAWLWLALAMLRIGAGSMLPRLS